MSSPHEFRQLARAAMQIIETRTVDQVLAEQERARKSKQTATPGAKGKPAAPSAPVGFSADQIAAAKALLARGKPRKE